ncbi:hypothetical protein B0T16DRAFT_409475 [Cercophora newfieldiana]|uniref:rRNA adenine N(6)-methyltransferase n=1 Tax=Cercophora newfieldiana TaxID=92897 RepID=A0AA39YAN3_9PEZI|nr:hypothetical protein B0T16DRAFT_409475 [Cercophora newfieldiana]
MLPFRSRPRALLSLRKGYSVLQQRGAKKLGPAPKPTADVLNAHNDVARNLAATGLWHKKPAVRSGKGDWRRISVTNEDFVYQIINYIKPSLLRHEGCDLIDLYPGAGVWSNALHDLLRPRSHILMEPDVGLYGPFLGRLLEKPGVRLEPKVGIDWTELNKILSPEYLPHQVEQPRTYGPDSEPPKRNDTLLVTANLSMHPKKKFMSFESLSLMVTYQLLSAIRASGLFQKYGLVRMLIWMRPDDMRTIFPRAVQQRRTGPQSVEFNTEWIREVAGLDYPDGEAGLGQQRTYYRRDANLDFESAFDTVLRMREQGIVVPEGRQSTLLREAQEMLAMGMTKAPTDNDPIHGVHIAEEYHKLEKQWQDGKIVKDSPTYEKLKRKTAYHKWIVNRATQKTTLLKELDAVKDLYAAGDMEEARFRDAEWNKKFSSLPSAFQGDALLQRDNQHIFRQEQPILHWDRRPYEPLVSRASDFFPNYQCSLLDIQPKAPHWLFRDIGPNSLYRAGECFELILRHSGGFQGSPLKRAMAAVWPGVLDGVISQCPSLYDRSQYGSPVSGFGELTARCLSEAQWVEIMDAWVKWPFKPSFAELVAHLGEELPSDALDDITPNNMGKAAAYAL